MPNLLYFDCKIVLQSLPLANADGGAEHGENRVRFMILGQATIAGFQASNPSDAQERGTVSTQTKWDSPALDELADLGQEFDAN